MKKYDLFISYSHKDKFDLVIPLVSMLEKRGLRVWFDKFEIKTGDSITDKINEGLIQARFGLIIISPSYIQSNWARQELNAFFKKQITLNKKHVLPIWYNISLEEMFDYFPLLADYRAIRLEDNTNFVFVVSELLEVIQTENYPENNQRLVTESEISEAQKILNEQLQLLLSKGRLVESIQFIKDRIIESEEDQLGITALSARFHSLENDRKDGKMVGEKYWQEFNALVKSLYNYRFKKS